MYYFLFADFFSFVSLLVLSFAPDSFAGESFLSGLSDLSDFSAFSPDAESDDPLSRASDFPA